MRLEPRQPCSAASTNKPQTKPTNEFGGHGYTFPKGTLDSSIGIRANAVKEVYEETGLKTRLLDHIGDFERDTSKVS